MAELRKNEGVTFFPGLLLLLGDFFRELGYKLPG